MANPFSGFLTPPQQTSALAGAPSYVMALSERQRGYNQDQQRKLENEQQNTRANARLGMEQAYQTRKFSQEDQKQVEALLAEYQDAEDQGDPVRLSRAAQMLQRFGMSVGQPVKPDLRAFTGEQSLPSVPKAQPTPETLQALTGSPAAPAQDLSQEDFESQLIAGSGKLPERMEQGGQSTDAMRAATSSPDEPVDMGDVDSPKFKQAAAQEGADGQVIDLDAEGPTPLNIGEAQQSQVPPRRLATQLLPTVVSKDGKKLYESTGPSGRWAPMVSGVFEPFAQHENPEIGSAAKRAQQMAAKLIAVDGVSPKDAINIGMDYLKGEASRINQLERTRLGTKPRYAGGGGGGVAGGLSFKADGALNDDLDKVRTMFVNSDQYKNVVQKRLLVDGALGQLQSDNGMSQQEAVSTLRRIQSGLTLNAFETQEFNNAAGAIEGIYNKFNKLAGGGQLSPEYKRQLMEVYSRINRTLDTHSERLAQQAYDYWMSSRQRSASGEVIQEKGDALKKSLRGAPVADPNADLDQ